MKTPLLPSEVTPETYPVTGESIRHNRTNMYVERIKAGLCPVCEDPHGYLDSEFYCTNLYCRFSRLFAQPVSGRAS